MKRFFCFILLSSIVLHHLTSNPSPKQRGEALRERIYMQTDKYLYLSGEPVLIKLLTTDNDLIPLVFSKVAYVELVADSVARLQIKVEITDGTGSGLMILPAELPTGYYRLMAYTQYMRNEGVDVFFEKNIAVVNTFQSGYYPAEEKTETSLSASLPALSEGDGVSSVSLQLDKAAYTVRTNGELIINGLPENTYTLSVSIAGKELIPVVEPDNSLFRKNQTKKTSDFSGKFLPEYEGHILIGKIVDNVANSLSVSNSADISSTSEESSSMPKTAGLSFPTVDGIRFFSGQEDETGNIRFYTSGIGGTNEIATILFQAGDKQRVEIQSPFVNRFVPKQMPALYIDSVDYGRLLSRSVALQVFRYFSDDPSENQSISDAFFKMKPTWSYPLDEYTRFTTMREVFIEFITGARFRRNAGKQEISIYTKRGSNLVYGTMPLVLLDGVPVSDHDLIYSYDPLSVEHINIYYGPYSLGGYWFDGIVEMTTYRRLHADLNLNRATQIITYQGPQLPYRLDTPGYSNEKNRQNRMPDSRHTLLWNPEVRTDGQTSIHLPFDTSDLTGEFQATVEGVTNDGKIIFATAFFKVE